MPETLSHSIASIHFTINGYYTIQDMILKHGLFKHGAIHLTKIHQVRTIHESGPEIHSLFLFHVLQTDNYSTGTTIIMLVTLPFES